MADPDDRLDSALQALFAEERRDQSVPAGVSDRLRVRLGPLLGAPPPSAHGDARPSGAETSGAGASGAGPVAAAAPHAMMMAKYAALLAVGVVAGAGAHASLAKNPPATIVYVAPAAAPSVPAVLPPPLLVAPAEAPRALGPPAVSRAPNQALRSVAPGEAATHPASEVVGDLAAERVGLEIARTALARGDSEAALAATDRYTRSFPHGQLREEADAIAIQALAREGRTDEAEARAAQFRRAYPHGLFRSLVDQAAP